jgi:nucleoside-diphosphate-sugar epimerase
MEKTILLAGGAGYIGTVLTNFFLKKNFKVICVDSLIYSQKNCIKDFLNNKNYKFIESSIVNINPDILKEVKNIIILAGLVGDPITKKYPQDSEKINLHEIKMFIDICNKKNLDKLIFVSTCSNYGIIPENVLADENYKLGPVSSYAKHKVEVEKYIMSLNGKVDYSPTILRFATAFGMSPRMRFDLTVNQFTRDLFNNKQLEIYDAETWRPYCHVNDFARLINIVIENPKEKTHFQIYNAGSDVNNFTKKKIVEEIIRIIPNSKFVFLKNDVDKRNYKVDFSKVKKELNFNTKYSVEFGVKEIIQSIKSGLFKNISLEKFGNYNIKI